MNLRMLVWFFAAAAIFSIPLCADYYFWALGESGVLGIEDAIMIPIMGSFMLALFLAPIVALITFIGTLRMNRKMNLLVWRKEQPIRSIVATLVFGLIALLAIFSGLQPFLQNMPMYEHYWQPVNVAWFLWALLMRGAYIDKLPVS